MYKIIPALLLTLVGCGNNSTPAIPPTSGDFVKNSDGVGTAKVFGVEFSVNVNSSGASSSDSFRLDAVDPDKSVAQKRFTIGDDVAVELESIDESEVSFLFNDQDYGYLKVGDKVVIDDERNIEVNGSLRLPTSSE